MVIKMEEKEYVKKIVNGLNMGIVSVDCLINKVENNKLKNLIKYHQNQYIELKEKLKKKYPYIQNELKHEKMLEAMIEMKTLVCDDKKIAKMLTEGNFQAVMETTHFMNEHDVKQKDILDYIHEFEEMTKVYIEDLKDYL